MNEVCINSKNLILIAPQIEILERRLKEENFYEKICINGKYENIYFPSDWPGKALVVYPMEIERRKKNPDILPYWTYNIIDKENMVVVGDICCKTEPNENNEIEIGYGINKTQKRKGYATEAVLSFVSYIFANTKVTGIKAECNFDNMSSICVLNKCGFNKIDTRFDNEDGNLLIWRKRKN